MREVGRADERLDFVERRDLIDGREPPIDRSGRSDDLLVHTLAMSAWPTVPSALHGPERPRPLAGRRIRR